MNSNLTAYALNELPPDERAAFEAQMKNDPALQKQAEEMKEFCRLLEREVTPNAEASFKPGQRAQLVQSFQSVRKIARPMWRRPAFLSGLGLAAAACLAVMLTIQHVKHPAEMTAAHAPAAPTDDLGLGRVALSKDADESLAETIALKAAVADKKMEAPKPASPAAPAPTAIDGLIAANAPPMPALQSPPEFAAAAAGNIITRNAGAAIQIPQDPMDFGKSAPVAQLGDVNLNIQVQNAIANNQAPAPTYAGISGTSGDILSTAPSQAPGLVVNGGTLEFQGQNTANNLRSNSDAVASVRDLNGYAVAHTAAPVSGPGSNNINAIDSSGNGDLTIAGTISSAMNVGGATSLSKSGSGSLTLNGSNTYTGSTTINGGATINAVEPDLAKKLLPIPALTAEATRLSGDAPPPAQSNPWQPGMRIGIFGGGPLAATSQDQERSQNVADATHHLKLANAFEALGDHDSAIREFQEVLRIDDYNSAARQGMERVEHEKNLYFASARDQMRARMLNDVSKGWEEQVPTMKGEVGAFKAAPLSSSLAPAVGLAPAARPATPPSPSTLYAGSISGSVAIDSAPPVTPYSPYATQPGAVVTFNPEPKKKAELDRLEEIPALRQSMVESERLAKRPVGANTATYRPILENPFTFVAQQPLSTFSLDVDTASYANVRRFLNSGRRPPPDAVRLEELVNYFPYRYEGPAADRTIGVQVDLADAPWQPLHRIARVAVKARDLKGERAAANFVFLLDVSGSMGPVERLPLIKQSLRLLVDQLREDDRVAIVTYAGESGVALESTPGAQKEKIRQAIQKLKAGGSTNGASGIRLAYEQAALNFKQGGINRVILCTDGDFNVGASNVQELEQLIAGKSKGGVFLSVLGVGTDNLHDHTMQALADRGNGNYHYLDSVGEARKVLVEQMTGTLVTVAKDVKLQVEFNPAQVAAYRLIGYEKRMLAKEDFNNDKKDAGEIGAGHTVTALYEIVPASLKYPDGKPLVDELKYALAPAAGGAGGAAAPAAAAEPATNETLTVKVRYKEPNEDQSKLFEVAVTDAHKKLTENDRDFQFAVSVAGFGMLLRGSPNSAELTWDGVRRLALAGKGEDEQGWRGEFIQLIEKARGLCEGQR